MIRLFILSIALATFTFAHLAQGDIIRVRKGATGAGDGTSWSDACDELSGGIARASAGDQVWVAAGTYTPILLKEGVIVLGGFAGTEIDASQRDPSTRKAIVSGDGTRQCVYSIGHTKATVCDGLYIQDGRANGYLESGGGAYLENSDAAFSHCQFTNNSAEFAGGAIANYGGSPTFTDCVFRDNGFGPDDKPPRASAHKWVI